jgi:RNA polymerase sigma-70 factor (ECF subfamily)
MRRTSTGPINPGSTAGRMNILPLINGDADAWDAFVEEYGGNVYSQVIQVLSRRRGRADSNTVSDVVSDVFHRLIKNDFRLLRTYRPEKSPMPHWIGLVARSTALNWVRRRSLNTVSMDEAPPIPADPAPAKTPVDLPEGLLSPRQALLLRMTFDGGLGTEEIAEKLQIDVQSVRSMKHVAIKKLRDYYGVQRE